jgi:hypothetical protein
MKIAPLFALGLAALAAPALAIIPIEKAPINTEFNGYNGPGDVTNATDSLYYFPNAYYDTDFFGTGPAVNYFGYAPEFVSDQIILSYNDFLDELSHGEMPVGETGGATTFIGTDILTAADGSTLDLVLAGNVFTTGTSTTENLTFTDPNGTGSLTGSSGTVSFTGTLFGQLETSAVPAGLAAPHTPTPQPIYSVYNAQYGPLKAAAVPEPAPMSLLALGLLPIGLIAARRKRIA